MSTKAPLPPNFKPPFWATKEFRLLLIVGVMGCSVLGVLIFDIGPMLTHGPTKAAKKVDPNAFVPQPATAGGTREVKFEGILEKVKDGTSIDDQDESYQYLIRYLARAEAGQISKEAKTVEYPYYSKMPVEMRGQTVKIMALFLTSNPIRVDREPGGIKFIHRTYLTDLRGTEGYVVDLLEPPQQLEQRSLVSMDAVFLKLGTYEGKKGPVQAPLFVGKSLRFVKERMAADPGNLGTGTIAGLAVFALLLLVVISARIMKKSRPMGPRGPAISFETSKS
jgi:hypothetical protein